MGFLTDASAGPEVSTCGGSAALGLLALARGQTIRRRCLLCEFMISFLV
jgi:hypothetical protein